MSAGPQAVAGGAVWLQFVRLVLAAPRRSCAAACALCTERCSRCAPTWRSRY
jgi:hypothetical protein